MARASVGEARRVANREWTRAWKRRNPDKVRKQKLRWANKKNARIRADVELHEMLKRQRRRRSAELLLERQLICAARPKPSRCEICDRGGKIFFDHCHATEEFRGWICSSCNTALGMLGDDVQIARKVVAYLERHASKGEANEQSNRAPLPAHPTDA